MKLLRLPTGGPLSARAKALNPAYRRFFATAPKDAHHGDESHHGHHDSHGPEDSHVRLTPGFYKFFGGFWACILAFVVQDRYFTRPDENGTPRVHPITRWILFYREKESARIEGVRQLLIEARQEGEVNVFHNLEVRRPVKDPHYDPRILKQAEWACGPSAQDIHYVDTSDIKWRKGYGEDKDSVEVLLQKGLKAPKDE